MVCVRVYGDLRLFGYSDTGEGRYKERDRKPTNNYRLASKASWPGGLHVTVFDRNLKFDRRSDSIRSQD